VDGKALLSLLANAWTCQIWAAALVNVEKSQHPFGNSRRLITDFDVGGNSRKAHNIVVRGEHWKEVWRYLYTHPVNKVGDPVPNDPDCKVKKPK